MEHSSRRRKVVAHLSHDGGPSAAAPLEVGGGSRHGAPKVQRLGLALVRDVGLEDDEGIDDALPELFQQEIDELKLLFCRVQS